MRSKVLTQADWEAEKGLKILDYLRNEIYLDLRFLDVALSMLTPTVNINISAFATDGGRIFYPPEHTIAVFKQNELFLKRAYLHTVLHCLYSHLWIKGNRETPVWNLAADIAVEYVLDGLGKPCTKRPLSFIRQQFYQNMQSEKTVSAGGIYRMLMDLEEAEQIKLQREFYTDDHRYWPNMENNRQNPMISKPELQQKWEQLSKQVQIKQDQSGKEAGEGEQLLFSQMHAVKARRTYGDFLRRFARLQEELHADPDEFDLTYYTFGLEHLGNMPLVEPVETREEKRIRDFVIAVDTSYSTSGELVQQFLKETFSILKEQNTFSHHCRIHILQCDDEVQSDTEITSLGQLEKLMEQFAIAGGGNTDFRPVFRYVNQLIEQRKLKNLGGLLYFTDGNGIYPKQKPAYQTAFLFLEEYEEDKVPAWAMRLKLEPDSKRKG
ncbi:MAG: VWA-like domain-containing protein [Lachnospiraceae bacterium]|nr:VWA-like domain-containing protein [Lachnospiraceae bacterium]